MFVSAGEYVAIGLVIIIAIVFVVSTRGGTKIIVCPECDGYFRKPTASRKNSDVASGGGFPDYYNCPKCGYKAPASNFKVAGSNMENRSV